MDTVNSPIVRTERPTSIGDTARAVSRHKLASLSAAVIVFGVTAAFFLTRKPSFTATTTIVAPQPDQTQTTSFASTFAGVETYPATTQLQLIQDVALRDKVAKQLGGVLDKADPQIVDIGKDVVKLIVQNPETTETLVATGVSSNAQLATKAVNQLADTYVAEIHNLQTADTNQAMAEVKTQIEASDEKLRKASAEQKQLQEQFHSAAPEKDLETEVEYLSLLNGKRDSAASDLRASESSYNALNTQTEKLQTIEPTVPNPEGDPNIQLEVTSLATLEAQREAALKTYTPMHPTVKGLDSQIASLKKSIDAQRGDYLKRNSRFNPDKRDLREQVIKAKADFASKQSALRELDSAKQVAERRLQSYPTFSVAIARAALEVDRYTKELQKYYDLENDLSLRPKATLPAAKIVSRASVPPYPTEIPKIILFGVMFVVSALVGGGVGISLDKKDKRLRKETLFDSLQILGTLYLPRRKKESVQTLEPINIAQGRNIAARLLGSSYPPQISNVTVASLGSLEDEAIAASSLALACAGFGLRVNLRVPKITIPGQTQSLHLLVSNLLDSTEYSHLLSNVALTTPNYGSLMEMVIEKNHPSSELMFDITITAATPISDLGGFFGMEPNAKIVITGRLMEDRLPDAMAFEEEMARIGASVAGMILMERSSQGNHLPGSTTPVLPPSDGSRRSGSDATLAPLKESPR